MRYVAEHTDKNCERVILGVSIFALGQYTLIPENLENSVLHGIFDYFSVILMYLLRFMVQVLRPHIHASFH